jgi:hypothetical protein
MIGRTLDFADVVAAVERDFPRATDREISRAIDIDEQISGQTFFSLENIASGRVRIVIGGPREIGRGIGLRTGAVHT